jgi:hypothetical protein
MPGRTGSVFGQFQLLLACIFSKNIQNNHKILSEAIDRSFDEKIKTYKG